MRRINSPHFCAAGIFSANLDMVLGVLPKGANQWKLPGGCGIPGETPAQTLEREIQEEVEGILIQSWEEVHYQQSPNQLHNINPHAQHFYLMKKWCGEIHTGWFIDDDEQKYLNWLEPLALTTQLFHTHQPGWRKIVQSAAINLEGFRERNFELVNRMKHW